MTYAQQRCLDILDNIEKLLEPLTIELRLDLYELREMITQADIVTQADID